LFGGGLNPPPIFSNRFASGGGDGELLKLLFPINRFPPLRFSNSCHPRLLVLVFCPNISNPVFWLLSYVISVVVPNILPRFGNVVTIG